MYYLRKVSLFAIIIVSIFFSQHAYCQQQGKVRVFTRPSDAIIKLDSNNIDYGKFTTVDTGKHIIKSWAKNRVLKTREIKIDSGYNKTVRIDLTYTKEYKNFRYNTIYYKVKKNVLRYAPILVSLIVISDAISDINTYQEDANLFQEEALSYQAKYESSFWEPDISFNKYQFQRNKENYNLAIDNLNKATNTLILTSVAAVAGTYLGWKISNKLKKPTYSEEPKLSQFYVSPVLSPNYNGLTFNYKLN